MSSRLLPAGAACLALVLLAVGSSAARPLPGAAPAAHLARVCVPPEYPGSGYFTSLTVRRVTCRTGRKVTLAHYRCRTASGPAGRCGHRVLKFRCREHRESIPTEIDSRVTCTRDTRKVVYTYQQNL